jgi:two-component system sensor histidine kinase UhpB
VNIACSVGPFARSYGDKIDLIVYRSVQEALTNAIRHGQASNIIVELREEQGADWETRDAANVISLRISDDGIGIKSGTQAGFGLSAMRERVLSARGSLAVEGHNPQGTTISVKIPGFASEPKGLVVSEDHRVTA